MAPRKKLDKKYLHWGLTAFCVILCGLLVFWGINKWTDFKNGMQALGTILSPFVYGFLFAYLLNRPMILLERRIIAPITRKLFRKKAERARKISRMLAVVITELLMWGVVGGLIALISPQLYQSVRGLVIQLPAYAEEAVNWAEQLLKDNPTIEQTAVNLIGNVSDALSNWFNSSVLPNINDFITNLTAGVISVVKGVLYWIIGIVISVYILYNKEHFQAQAKKLLYGLFKPETANAILNEFDYVNQAFGGFIIGKLIDSLIIGIMAYIGLSILKMPYVALVSLIIGVTNVIPVFGPLIGAIPCGIIILMESPIQCLIFVIFVILLQQFDGNFLGPKILGNAIGLSGFWIMLAILLFGGIGGLLGMFLGVPLMAVIYNAVRRIIEKKLEKRGLPTATERYEGIAFVDGAARVMVYQNDTITPIEGSAPTVETIARPVEMVSVSVPAAEEIPAEEPPEETENISE